MYSGMSNVVEIEWNHIYKTPYPPELAELHDATVKEMRKGRTGSGIDGYFHTMNAICKRRKHENVCV